MGGMRWSLGGVPDGGHPRGDLVILDMGRGHRGPKGSRLDWGRGGVDWGDSSDLGCGSWGLEGGTGCWWGFSPGYPASCKTHILKNFRNEKLTNFS